MTKLNLIYTIFACCAMTLMPNISYAEAINCPPHDSKAARLTIPGEAGVQLDAVFNGVEVRVNERNKSP